jgi:hypothetical protein
MLIGFEKHKLFVVVVVAAANAASNLLTPQTADFHVNTSVSRTFKSNHDDNDDGVQGLKNK